MTAEKEHTTLKVKPQVMAEEVDEAKMQMLTGARE